MYYLNFSIFTVILKNRNIINSKMKRSKVTDYVAFNALLFLKSLSPFFLTSLLGSCES